MASGNVDRTLVSKVVKELLDYEARKTQQGSSGKSHLLGSYSKPFLIQVQLANEIKEPVIHPIRVQIPNSMFSPDKEDHSICMFCRTEDKELIDEYLVSSPIEGLKSIISLSQVKKLYSTFKDKKELLSNHTHFVCDMRVLNHLYNLLGKVFGKRNNYPLPLRLTKVSALTLAINNTLSATHLYLSGKSISIRFGHSGMSHSEIVDNVVIGLKNAVPKFPKGGKTIRSIHIKLSDSAALPIYSHAPDAKLDYVKQRVLESASASTTIASAKKSSASTNSSSIEETVSDKSTKKKRKEIPSDAVEVVATKTPSKKNKTSSAPELAVFKEKLTATKTSAIAEAPVSEKKKVKK